MTPEGGSRIVRIGVIFTLGVATLVVWGMVFYTIPQDSPSDFRLIETEDGGLVVDPGPFTEGPEPPVPTGPVRVNMDRVETPSVIDRESMDVCERAAWDIYPGSAQWGLRSQLMEGCRTSQSRTR